MACNLDHLTVATEIRVVVVVASILASCGVGGWSGSFISYVWSPEMDPV